MTGEKLIEKVIGNRLLFCAALKSFIDLQVSYPFPED